MSTPSHSAVRLLSKVLKHNKECGLTEKVILAWDQKTGNDYFLPHPFQYVTYKISHSTQEENNENPANRMSAD